MSTPSDSGHAIDRLPPNNDQQNMTAASMREQIFGFRNTQLIAVAAKLNVAELLKDGAKSARELSVLTESNEGALYRLLRALTTIGIFSERVGNQFVNNQASELLLDETPGSLRSIAILYGEPWLWNAYGELLHSVKSGKQGFQHNQGRSLYEFLQQNQKAASIFNSAMTAFSGTEADAIIKAYNFSLKNKVVDVGGGEGFLVSALLKAHQNLTGAVLDLPADHIENSRRIDSRINFLFGDFFKEVPSGGDVYILKSVLHNWDDTACVKILKNCRKAMVDNATLLVIERMIPEGEGKSEAKLFDINMLIMTDGQERTENEYGKLFRAAGFMLTRSIPTQSSLSIIEGLPVSADMDLISNE